MSDLMNRRTNESKYRQLAITINSIEAINVQLIVYQMDVLRNKSYPLNTNHFPSLEKNLQKTVYNLHEP